ncbi:ImmA/IrrE family metallo-endopeptidase [Puteibacter caeruleilacunae]|nr:ImmA/IrrE family metallo-endopeptidase [Puteibacter caeruleilacunae]
MNEIFAIRLKSARVMKGLSMDNLVDKMKGAISKNAISKYEKGVMTPDSTRLIALAKALDCSIDYFFRPVKINLEKIEFRKRSALKSKEANRIKEIVKHYTERYLEIEEILAIKSGFKNPISHLIIKNSEDINLAVRELRESWKIGYNAIPNVVKLLEDKGIKVIEIHADDQFDGLSSFIDNTFPIIVINKQFTPERKRFTALHELGHLLLSIDESLSHKEIENLCNAFANKILIADEVFIENIGNNRHHIVLQELQRLQIAYGISIDALMHKAKDLNCISESRYKYYWIKKNQDANLKESINKSRYVQEVNTERFTSLVYRALASELISNSKASELAIQPLSEIKKLKFV